VLNALTVDVEDYFHVAALSSSIDREHWDRYECRVEHNTQRLLHLFAEHKTKATFFVLGWVAERYPALVREIAAAGHEIASHGYSHQLVYRQTPEVFRQETQRSKDVLEDQVQQAVLGYRAASYSITQQSLWALDILAELGFVWDSSIFPIRHDRYGIPGASRWPHRLRTPAGYELVEFPLSTWRVGAYRLPIAGGGYFRLYPYALTRKGLASINQDGRPFIFYLHPWEVDPAQPRIKASLASSFRHYNNLSRCEPRLRRLLGDFRFTTVAQVLKRNGLLQAAAPSAEHSAAALATASGKH
jgi:polysaccharide deacetylase family protein (PEP-CTERM system associated)